MSARNATRRSARLLGTLVIATLAGGASPGRAQVLSLSLESGDVHAGLPFVLTVRAEGFEEEPAPEAPELDIAGCTVTFLGVSPQVSSIVRIVNGRRTDSRSVTFNYRYRILAPRPGRYTVPAIELVQGGTRARSPGGSFDVGEVESTEDMKLQLRLPDRAVYVGETFDVTIDWYLRRDPSDPTFVIPLFDTDGMHVDPAPDEGSPRLQFAAGARDIQLPYERTTERLQGKQYTLFRFRALVTPSRPGTVELEAPVVMARLEAGFGRDAFGFRVRRRELFTARGRPSRLTVRALPQAGRPPGFVNALGSGFSIAVQASRTVVQVGEPIDLRINVRGDGRLEGLSLPPLAAAGLPPESFAAPSEPATGVIADDGASKTFEVTVRLKSQDVTEIPPLSLSYFDPRDGAYETVRSEPIALSVRDTRVVGAGDVVASRRTPPAARVEAEPEAGEQGAASAPRDGPPTGSLVGANLALSPPGRTLARAATVKDRHPLLALLYGVPVALLAWRLWHERTRDRRGRASVLRGRAAAARAALRGAGTSPAREAGPRVVTELRALGRLVGGDAERATSDLLDRLEIEAFDPRATDRPLPTELLEEASRAVARLELAAQEALAAETESASRAATLGLALAFLGASASSAPAASADPIEHVRALYQSALTETDRSARTRAFAEAERVLGELASQHPDCPELQADWGNAALGAQDLGRAVVAYRRALRLDPRNDRAASNLAWLRARAPRWLPRPAARTAVDSLLFWHRSMSRADRHLAGAAAFAIAVLLVAPWPGNRTRSLRRLSLLPALAWIALTTSALVDDGDVRAAVVVVDGTPVRSADSRGAPPALGNPLPAGTELEVLEERGTWTRVALPDGTRGWLKAHAVERVVPPA